MDLGPNNYGKGIILGPILPGINLGSETGKPQLNPNSANSYSSPSPDTYVKGGPPESPIMPSTVDLTFK